MSYNSIKSSVVSLTVDIEDKSELYKSIQNRIDLERSNLAKIDKDLEESYQLAVQDEAIRLKSTLDSISREATSLLEKKKELFIHCEKAIENIKSIEKYVGVEIRKIHNDTEEKLEQEKKVFKSNFESRVQGAITSKYAMLKESTDRAMQPELERIIENHKREVKGMEQKYKVDEMKLIEDYSRKLSIVLEEEKSVVVDHRKLNNQALEDKFYREVQALEREHKFRVACLKEELDKELEKHKETVQAKLDKDRKESRSDVIELEGSIKVKLDDVRSNHSKEISILEKAQQERIKEIKKRHLDKIAQIASSLQESHVKCIGPNTTSAGSPLRFKGGHTIPLDNPDLIELKKKMLAERDAKIQSEIRNMQTETIKLERELVSNNNEEKKKIKDAFEREERLLMASLESLNDQIADIIIEKEILAKENKATAEDNMKMTAEINDLDKEIEIFENGIRVQKMRSRDNRLMYDKLISEEEYSLQNQIDDIKANCDRLHSQLQQRDGDLKLEIDLVKEQHEKALESLDSDVKSQLLVKDQELVSLADEMQTERIKIAKYEKLIKQYAI